MYHVTRIIKHFARLVRTHRSTIMATAEVGGLVGTFVLTVRANHKANERRHEAMAEKGEDLTTWQIFVAEAPAYILPFIIMLLTGGTIVLNDIWTVKDRKAWMATTVGLTKLLNDYKHNMSKEQQEEVLKKMAEEAKSKVPDKPDGEQIRLFYDSFSDRYFWDTIENVLCAEADCNRRFNEEGDTPLNYFYAAMGNKDLPVTNSGWDLGWSWWQGEEVYGYRYIDFWHLSAYDEVLGPYTVIDMPFPPTADFMDDPYAAQEVDHIVRTLKD